MRTCRICQKEKPLTDFPKASVLYREGRQYACKVCQRHKNWALKLKREFGTTPEEYSKKQKKQKNLCAICEKAEVGGWRLAQDHNHRTGTARGLLCRHCNLGLGNFFESPVIMKRAMKYLRFWASVEAKVQLL